jgi:hypothetical protein
MPDEISLTLCAHYANYTNCWRLTSSESILWQLLSRYQEVASSTVYEDVQPGVLRLHFLQPSVNESLVISYNYRRQHSSSVWRSKAVKIDTPS